MRIAQILHARLRSAPPRSNLRGSHEEVGTDRWNGNDFERVVHDHERTDRGIRPVGHGFGFAADADAKAAFIPLFVVRHAEHPATAAAIGELDLGWNLECLEAGSLPISSTTPSMRYQMRTFIDSYLAFASGATNISHSGSRSAQLSQVPSRLKQ